MRSRTVRQGAVSLLTVLAVGLGLAACGDDDGDGGGGSTMEPVPLGKPADFPKAEGKTLVELRTGAGAGPVLAPSVSVLEPGRNRYGFGLFDRARKQIALAPVALYVARSGGGPVKGPYLARFESLEVKPQFESQSVKADPDAATSLYVADLPFRRPGEYEVLGLVRLDERLVAATPAGPATRLDADKPATVSAVQVKRGGGVPEVGEPAPRTHTPTLASVGGDPTQIETRVPPDTMHEVDFADVVGKRPVVLVFATPALCQSRVCGPVVDIAEQVKAEHKDVAFIHMEIYKDNEFSKGVRPQVVEWGLPSEPWAFAVDRTGRIAARLEGAFSARELEHAVKAALKR
jgi:hypothetical protein